LYLKPFYFISFLFMSILFYPFYFLSVLCNPPPPLLRKQGGVSSNGDFVERQAVKRRNSMLSLRQGTNFSTGDIDSIDGSGEDFAMGSGSPGY
jgi:hypothetical protein